MFDANKARGLPLTGDKPMRAAVQEHDWASTTIGDPASWPGPLRAAVDLLLGSIGPTWLAWGPELVFLYNDAYRPLLGAKHPDALGIPLREVWEEIWPDVGPLVERTLAGDPVLVRDAPLRVQRGTGLEDAYFTFSYAALRDGTGTVQGLFCSVLETTEGVLAGRRRDAAEIELRELNQTLERQVQERTEAVRLFANIVESASSPICAFDDEFRLVAFNKAHSDEFFRIYGYRVQMGDVFPDLFLPDQAPVMRALMARALTGEIFTVIEEFGDPDVTKPCWEISYSPLRDDGGKVIGAFHYATDVSFRVRTQAELEVTQEALRQSQKMEAVGQLTGGLAHDFNNLLAGISGSLDMMQTRIAQGRVSEIERYMIGAQGAARRAAALTHRLLAFSRRQTLDPKPTDVNRLVAGMEDLIQRTVGPQIMVETVTASGLWPALVDPNQLENALLNLSINARDAMPDGGRITIETANRWLDDHAARERDVLPGQYLSLCVSDNGTGMSKDVVERAFDPFFTTKPIGVGTGLGLSMIYGFARQSGGQARIYSEVGQGTTICLYLPRHHVGETLEGPVAPEPVERPTEARTVLVIDDEPLVRMLLVDAVEDLGYTALEAGDGPQGLKVLRSDVKIDLLITDVGLPNGMNGRQVGDAARELRPDLKVLFVTGYAENAVLNHGHLDPGMQVVTKPFDMNALTRRIHCMITD